MKYYLIIIFGFLLGKNANSQQYKIGADYGRAYFFYKHLDDGNGLIKSPESNYHFLAGVSLTRRMKHGLFLETGLRFSMYEQYFSTRKYWGAFEEAYPVIHIPILVGYETTNKLGFAGSAGIIIGAAPDFFTGEFMALSYNDLSGLDSMTRGTVYRNFTPVFPLLNVNAKLKFRINDKWHTELKVSYGKGFIKITEYDIYYNDGSGMNDQHARQWGTGDFASLSLGITYTLPKKTNYLKRISSHRANYKPQTINYKLLQCTSKLLQKPCIILAEQTDVVDAV